MDREISKGLFEVENPVYQSHDEIMKQYYDNRVVITNEKKGEKGKLFSGGIVRYYGSKYSKEIYDKWDECCRIEEYDPVRIIGVFPSNPFGGLFRG